MKLYTEEQVRKAMSALNDIKYMYHSDDDIFDSLTPIELPSEEEIEKIELGSGMHDFYKGGFIEGAKWVIEQIKQQGNGK